MKTRTKALLLALSAVLLVVSTVMATMAFLTSKTEVVKNTFTVGNVNITLDEAKVNEYGKPVDANGNEVLLANAPRQTTNTYKLLPGHTYTKDPIVHVTKGSEECWLFVRVVDQIADIQDATTVAAQMAAKGWALVTGQTDVWAYNTKVDARNEAKDIPVFDSFKITGTADVAAYDGKTITVQAYAIQADGFDTAEAAWTAAPATWGEDTTAAPETTDAP
jgi:predicted ribosomally synthesized peptide with SipW-like signal peptide